VIGGVEDDVSGEPGTAGAVGMFGKAGGTGAVGMIDGIGVGTCPAGPVEGLAAGGGRDGGCAAQGVVTSQQHNRAAAGIHAQADRSISLHLAPSRGPRHDDINHIGRVSFNQYIGPTWRAGSNKRRSPPRFPMILN
jgi:hypothetical protein